jgi:hypothetical protein
MADTPKTYSEREKVLAERAAFVAGAGAAHLDRVRCESVQTTTDMYSPHDRVPYFNHTYAKAVAAREYPLPKVIRPRVLIDPKGDWQWSVRDGRLMQRTTLDACNWYDANNSPYPNRFQPLASRVMLWADLLANPNEEVEA